MKEVRVNGYESKYLISNFGRVYNVNNKCQWQYIEQGGDNNDSHE